MTVIEIEGLINGSPVGPQHPRPPPNVPPKLTVNVSQSVEVASPENRHGPLSTKICQPVSVHEKLTSNVRLHTSAEPDHNAPVPSLLKGTTNVNGAHVGQSTVISANKVFPIGRGQHPVATEPQVPPHQLQEAEINHSVP